MWAAEYRAFTRWHDRRSTVKVEQIEDLMQWLSEQDDERAARTVAHLGLYLRESFDHWQQEMTCPLVGADVTMIYMN